MAPPKRPNRKRRSPNPAVTRAQRDVLRAQGAARDRLAEREQQGREQVDPAAEAQELQADHDTEGGDSGRSAGADEAAEPSRGARSPGRRRRPAARRTAESAEDEAEDEAAEGDEPQAARRTGLMERLLGAPQQRRTPRAPAAERAAEPEPWSLRGLYTLSLVVVFLQTIVWLVRYLFTDHTFQPSGTKLNCTVPFLVVMVQSDPIQVLLLTFVGMRVAERIAGEGRRMRVLETLSYGAVAFMLGYFLLTITFQVLRPPSITSCDIPLQYVLAFGISTYGGFALAPPAFRWMYRRFWMPRRRMSGR